MAEANFDAVPDLSLEDTFEKAAAHLQTLFSKLDSRTLLSAYGLYKQATAGACDTPQPGWFQMQAKQKWEAWKALKDMTSETAMEKYVALIAELDPSWEPNANNAKTPGWVAVSSMMADSDAEIDDSEKTIFDWVKEGDVTKVRELSETSEISSNGRDSDGMGLLHWAADRGSLPMVRFLVTQLKADVNLTDSEGQTPLHYACACGYFDVVKFLLENKANPNVGDGGGFTPSDVACNETNIIELLNQIRE